MNRVLAYLLGITLILSSLYVAQKPGVLPFIPSAQTTSAYSVDLMGEAWSENIGWISFNCATTPAGCDGFSDYKVTLDTVTNNLSGYAWSENIGWIQFGGLTGCPAGDCDARMENGELMGWARVVNGDAGGTTQVPVTIPLTASGTYSVPAGVTSVSVKAWGAGGGAAGLATPGTPTTFATAGTFSDIVPAGVTSATVKAWGGGGGTGGNGHNAVLGPNAGGGGFAGGTVTVTPGETLSVVVGDSGKGGRTSLLGAHTPGAGGAPGGGAGADTVCNFRTPCASGGGGGGYSGLFRGALSQANALVVAGGGGGTGGIGDRGSGSAGGAGGGASGSASSNGSGGGTQLAGGAGTGSGIAGSALTGGAGASGRSYGGGGGGAGYFGGGGGNGVDSDAAVGSGGGGSSYGTTLIAGSGRNAGNMTDSAYITGVGMGAAGTLGYSNGMAGGSGGGSASWDISAVSLLNVRSVSAQANDPRGIFFRSDGAKLYVVNEVGPNAASVNEYNLSSAWNISTASFVQTRSVSAQDGRPRDIFFDTSGTKMYLTGNDNDRVNEYSLSTAWNISTATFVQFKSVAAEDVTPHALFFKPDGTKMYVGGNAAQEINEYNLSTPWNISTASFLQTFDVTAQDTEPRSIFFKPDGTKMFMVGYTGSDVNEYNLSTPWNISTLSFVRVLSVYVQNTEPVGLSFNPGGTKMYVGGMNGSGEINEYDLITGSTPGLVSLTYNTPVLGTGGGGGYAASTVAVTPLETLNIDIGTGGAITGTNGGDSVFRRGATPLVRGGGGSGGVGVAGAGGVGYVSGTGTTTSGSGTTPGNNTDSAYVAPYGVGAATSNGAVGSNGYVTVSHTLTVPTPVNGSDGWISLNASNHGGSDYQVEVGVSELTGFAWGSDVVGWISFNCSNETAPTPCAASNYRVYFDTLPCGSPSYQCSTDNTQSIYRDAWCTTATTTCNVGEMCRADMGSICGPGNPTGQLLFSSQRVRKGNTTNISWPTLAAYDMCRVQGTPTGGNTDSWSWSSTTPLVNVTTSAIQNEVTYTLECTRVGDLSLTYQLLDTERVMLLPSIKEF